MTGADFLELLLADATEAERALVLHQPDALGWSGTLRALAECRTAFWSTGDVWEEEGMATRLNTLLDEARLCTRMAAEAPDAWYWLCREAIVEWIASVVSAMLVAQRMRPVLPPSRAAIQEAARLLDMA